MMIQTNEEIREWIRARRQEGHSDESIKQSMINGGYSTKFIEETLKRSDIKESIKYQKKNSRKILIPLIIAVFLVLIVVISISLLIKKPEVPKITSDSNLDRLIFDSVASSFEESSLANCNVAIEDSLINLVHIRKNGSEYQISCEYGDLYQNVSHLSPETNVYLGHIRKCDVETAREIDQIINSGVFECRVPLFSYQFVAPLNLTDYYLFTLVCRLTYVTQEYIDNIKNFTFATNVSCKTDTKPLIGKTISERYFVGIIDTNTNSVLQQGKQ